MIRTPAYLATVTGSTQEHKMPRVVFVVTKPTPQRTPTLDALSRGGTDLMAVYVERDHDKNGWGRVESQHPHRFVENSVGAALGFALALARSRGPHVMAVFGHRGLVRLSALLVARVRRWPLVVRSDANIDSLRDEPWWRVTLRRRILRLLVPARARVWTIGTNNESYWRDYVGRRNILRIPYVVPRLPDSEGPPPVARRSDPQNMRFLYVGRLHTVKAPMLLLEAFARLDGAECAEWRLDIVGDGPLRAQVEEAAGADSRVHVHGACEYRMLDRYYRNSDVLVLPSTAEPWGLVVNEALGFGLWTLVTDRVGARELITSRAQGAVVPSGDVEELTAAMREAVDHLERRPRPTAADTARLMGKDLQALLDSTS